MARAFTDHIDEATRHALNNLSRSALNSYSEHKSGSLDGGTSQEELARSNQSPQSHYDAARNGPAQLGRPRSSERTLEKFAPQPLHRSTTAVSDDKLTEPHRLTRSDRIAVVSIMMALMLLALRYRYSDYAREMIVEFRFVLGLAASCFMLGISGWFNVGEHRVTKTQAIVTMGMLLVMMSILELLLSGTLVPMASKVSSSVMTLLK